MFNVKFYTDECLSYWHFSVVHPNEYNWRINIYHNQESTGATISFLLLIPFSLVGLETRLIEPVFAKYFLLSALFASLLIFPPTNFDPLSLDFAGLDARLTVALLAVTLPLWHRPCDMLVSQRTFLLGLTWPADPPAHVWGLRPSPESRRYRGWVPYIFWTVSMLV